VTREDAEPVGLPGGSALRLADRLLASGVCPSEALRREELRARVRTALEALAEADREVLVLRYLEQLSAQEVGAVLGVSESAAKKRALRDSAIFRNNLGIALARAGQLREAAEEFLVRLAFDLDNASAKSEAIRLLLIAQRRQPNDLWINVSVAYTLAQMGPEHAAEAVRFYTVALALRPADPIILGNLGYLLSGLGRHEDAITYLRQSTTLRDSAIFRNNLGIALARAGQLREAAEEFRRTVAQQPDYHRAWHNLGGVLHDLKLPADAVEALKRANALSPDVLTANRLSACLAELGRHAEAEAAAREAVKLGPRNAEAQFRLGLALMSLGRYADAAESFRASNKLMPYPTAAYNLGTCMIRLRRWPEAEATLRQAVQLNEGYAKAHHDLGFVLLERGDSGGAAAALRTAVRLRPDDATAHYNLGKALDRQKDFGGAAVAYRKATQLRPEYAEAHCNLGQVLRKQGRFAEALVALRRGHELGTRKPGWRYPSDRWVREVEPVAALEVKLPAVLAGREQYASAKEYLLAADLCWRCQKRYAAAARLFTEAFAIDATLVEMLDAYRYRAARAAALAGCGQGKDAAGLDDKECAHLRLQALDWLRADLGAWRRLLEKEPDKDRPAVAQQMQHWLADPDFAGVRGAAALGKLPEAERPQWQKLWAEIESLQHRAAGAAKPPAPVRPQGKEVPLKDP
jgi:tetratricopeptide (TPR) repeat protein